MADAVSSEAGTPGARPSGWRVWGRRRRKFAALTVVAWLATAALFAIGVALQSFWVAAAAIPVLCLEWWSSAKWRAAEVAEGAPGHLTAEASHEEREGRGEPAQVEEEKKDEEEEGSPVDDEWLDDDDPLLYPSRESLMLRSGSEAAELLGLGLFFLGFQSVWLAASGGVLWLIGGDRGARVTRGLLDQRLHRTPVSDDARERWFRIEDRALGAFYPLALLVLAAVLLL